jgi:acyl-CoA thioesterase-2
MFTWPELRDVLHVEQLDTYLFRGASLSLGLPRVFGGQVLAQSLNAAYRSAGEDRVPHSMHGYFLRPGDFTKPIIYEVDPIRNGRSFSTRRVVARQNGEAIFNSSVSFHRIEEGPSHQIDIPENIPGPDGLPSDSEQIDLMCEQLTEEQQRRLRSSYLIFPKNVVDLKSPFLGDLIKPKKYDPQHGFWFKFTDDVGDDPVMHLTCLAYISDKALMGTGIRPHGDGFFSGKMMGASLDHAMWFHNDVRVNDWIYYYMDSPLSGRARTFNRGSFYAQSGTLLASTAQEGLFRHRKS